MKVDQGDQGIQVWDAPIGAGKDPRHRAAFGPDAKASQTRWTVIARAGCFAMLAVEPQTGRTHQIRVHASHAGAPLLGDRDYGGATRVTLPDGRVVALARIALHAARVTVPDARGGQGMTICSRVLVTGSAGEPEPTSGCYWLATALPCRPDGR